MAGRCCLDQAPSDGVLHCLGQVQSSLSGALSFKPSCSICTALAIDFFSPEGGWSLKPPNEEQLHLYPRDAGAREHSDTLFRFLARPEQPRYN